MTPNMLKQKKVLVVGAGVTGASVARFLLSYGISFDIVDKQGRLADDLLAGLPDTQCFVTLNAELTTQYDVLILSPGVPRAHAAIQAALESGKTVIGDIELFAGVVSDPVIAVTGSNGKSTVVSMLAHVLKAANRKAVLCGNIGVPVLDAIGDAGTLYVVELSSYQLESTSSLAPYAACVLNVSDDHLDRYDSIEHYAKVKQHIYHNAQHIIANLDDELTHPSKAANDHAVDTYMFSASENVAATANVRDGSGELTLRCSNESVMSASELPLPGEHNVANALAVLALLKPLKLDVAHLREGLASFKGLPHRTELIATTNNVRFYNDSKGTNVDACLKAIRAMGAPVILIAGGQGKGADFSALRADVTTRVKALVLMGEDRELLRTALDGAAPVYFADSMQDAVNQSSQLADNGDVVLLSPACASFDMFENFEARGRSFAQAVEALVA